jgi:hypothetical protein
MGLLVQRSEAVRRSLVARDAWKAGRWRRVLRGVDGTTGAAVGGSEVRAVMRSVIARDAGKAGRWRRA